MFCPSKDYLLRKVYELLRVLHGDSDAEKQKEIEESESFYLGVPLEKVREICFQRGEDFKINDTNVKNLREDYANQIKKEKKWEKNLKLPYASEKPHRSPPFATGMKLNNPNPGLIKSIETIDPSSNTKTKINDQESDY
jgi:hypothetical protein